MNPNLLLLQARAGTLTASQCAVYDEAKQAVVAYTGWGDRCVCALITDSRESERGHER